MHIALMEISLTEKQLVSENCNNDVNCNGNFTDHAVMDKRICKEYNIANTILVSSLA